MFESWVCGGIFAKKQLTWVVRLSEHLHNPPIIKDNILQLGLGTSIILSARTTRMIRFPFTINQIVEFRDVGNLSKGVQF